MRKVKRSPASSQPKRVIQVADAKTLSVPEAGRLYYALNRGASYLAAKRGDLPTIKVGRYLRVPVAAMEKRLAVVV
jgi:hypothetical protein